MEQEEPEKTLIVTMKADGSVAVKGNCLRKLLLCYAMFERAKDIVREINDTPIEASRIERPNLVLAPGGRIQ